MRPLVERVDWKSRTAARGRRYESRWTGSIDVRVEGLPGSEGPRPRDVTGECTGGVEEYVRRATCTSPISDHCLVSVSLTRQLPWTDAIIRMI